MTHYTSLIDTVGNTPLVQIKQLYRDKRGNTILAKLEGNNPAGSVKDRPALNMIKQAEQRGDIKSGDTLIEATSGNTGIALAMVAAVRGYKIKLIMPDNMTQERKDAMRAYGAQLILVSRELGMEGARDLAQAMAQAKEGFLLDQFSNPDNYMAHYLSTGPEIWQQTERKVSHFISAMGTTGTIMGTSLFLKEHNPSIQIIGVQPSEGAQIPGIRRWEAAYLPKIFNPSRIDKIIDINQHIAEETMRQLAQQEGIFAGVSSGGAMAATLKLAEEVNNATIVTIICDRGDRYLSSGLFSTGTQLT
jgi:cysteine synthase B